MIRIRSIVPGLLLAAALAGCSSLDRLFCAPDCHTEVRNSSSLVGFLYPEGQVPPPSDAVPELRLPLRVGLAFLPPQSGAAGPIDAAHRERLLERIRARFADRPFVRELVILPDHYLGTNRGFAGLEGVQRLYSVDLVALVSYDQVTHSDDRRLSLGYLTIVGAYVLRGTRNDTSTLVDLAVVDPATRTLVLRAGGTDTRAANTTLVEAARDARRSGEAGFDAATDALIANFDDALKQFEANVRAGKANVRVAQRAARTGGGSGGGALEPALLLLLAGLLVVRRRP